MIIETSKEYVGKITAIKGARSRYAVVDVPGFQGSVTFTLTNKVWKGSTPPNDGIYVILSELEENNGRWRAQSARPKDE